jgi:hypothetical protein
MSKSKQPYLFVDIVVKKRTYNPDFGDRRVCQCKHLYRDHFETDALIPTGCRKCECFVFMLKGK